MLDLFIALYIFALRCNLFVFFNKKKKLCSYVHLFVHCSAQMVQMQADGGRGRGEWRGQGGCLNGEVEGWRAMDGLACNSPRTHLTA